MTSKWTITPGIASSKINFQWILLYQKLHTLIFTSLDSTTNWFNIFIKSQTLIHNNVILSTNLTFTKPMLNRLINSKMYFKTPKFTRSNQPKLLINTTSSFYNLFLIYVQYSTINSQQFFVPHTNFKYLFLFTDHRATTYLNISKLHLKWINICNFIINLFLIQSHLLIFTVKTLQQEALSFNWSSNSLNYNLFRYASPIFFNKDTNFGPTSTLIFKKLTQKNVHTVFLTDVKYHEKTLHYLKKFHITTIGLIPYNLNPWLVTYTIPTSTNSLFVQYFFLKILIYLKQYSLQQSYNLYKNLWI